MYTIYIHYNLYVTHMNIVIVAALQITPKGQDGQFTAAWWLKILILKPGIYVFSLLSEFDFFFEHCLTQYLQLLSSYSASKKIINITSFKEK